MRDRRPAGGGRDAQGASLFVVETSLGRYDGDTGMPPDDPDVFGCGLRQFWLERGETCELTLSLCDDGYGASGVGEDSVAVGTNRLAHDQTGGSYWRRSSHGEFELSPRREVLAEEEGQVTVVVRDDVLVPSGDVLAVDWSEGTPAYYEPWLDPAASFETVRIDGARCDGIAGDPWAIQLLGEREPRRVAVHFLLPVEPSGGRLTPVYSDASAPGRPERTFATSAYHEGDASLLGARSLEFRTSVA